MKPINNAIISGVLFALWPLIMNKSGINGQKSALLMSSVCTVIFAFYNYFYGGVSNLKSNWYIGCLASVMAGVGILFFNDMLAKASSKNISMLFISMTVIQIVIAFAYNIIVNGGELSLYKVLGCVLCIIGIILVNL